MEKQSVYTILGAGGAIGTPLTTQLVQMGKRVRLASRSGVTAPGAETVQCDLLSFKETLFAAQNSQVIFLLAGLQYNHKIWQEQWPLIMDNCIKAARETGARLIFFDNVYMYGLVEGKMTEETPYNPCSKKGEVRANIARKLEEEFQKGSIDGLIARAADFYGPFSAKTSIISILVLDKMLKGNKPQWTGSSTAQHSLTFTIDAAKALVLLAESAGAGKQVWHLPTKNPGLTGQQYVQLAADILQTETKLQMIPTWMMRVGGFFDKTLAELVEMQYQQAYPYHFDSTKFENSFSYQPVSYRDGIEQTITYLSSL